ncbi:MAG: hypothetical protein R3293_28650, partial [Candidatus Promineifilaceae bacterium]|nr:hypothetical protein [Candidatus Promineifilaceae bacterium]
MQRILFPYPQQFGFFPDIYEYVTLLRERGFEAFYIGIDQGNHHSNLPDFTRHLTADHVPMREFIRFVVQQIADIKPDIVHSFHFRGSGTLPLLARKSAKKWVVDVRTIHVETQNLKMTSDFWLRDRLTWLETQSYDYVLALTEKIHDKLRPSIRPVRIVPLGASYGKLNAGNKSLLREKTRYSLNLPMEDPVILYAGSLSPTRQVDKLIKGFSLLLEHFPKAKLLLVGGELGCDIVEDPLIRPLLRLSEELSISSQVVFT